MEDKELAAAIAVLERKVDEAERKANNLRGALNFLREEAGQPPRPPGSGSEAPDNGSGAVPSGSLDIRSDTFFGKPQQTAVRQYLDMRKSAGLDGPSTPREIYEALVAGGFKYDTKDDATALVGLRALLRKRSNVFTKVGKGKYGLVNWYPNPPKPSASKSTASGGNNTAKESEASDSEDEDEDTADEGATSQTSAA